MTAEGSCSSGTAYSQPSRLSCGASFALLCGLIAGAVGLPSTPASADAPAHVAIVVPLSVQAGATGFVTAAQLSTATSTTGYLTRMLDAIVDKPVAIAIDPMIIVSIRILGSDAPESAVGWLDRLSRATNDTFELSYADSDVTLALQAGSPNVLEPQGFGFSTQAARFSESTSGGTQSRANESGNGLPTAEDLLSWDYSLNHISWPVANTVTSADIDKIAASGFSTTIVSSDNAERVSSDAANARLGNNTLVVTEAELSSEFNNAVTASDTSSWQSSLMDLSSMIVATTPRSGAPASYVLALDRGLVGNPAQLQNTINGLDIDPRFTVSTLAEVMSGASTTARIVDAPHPESKIALVSPLLSNEAADSEFAQVAIDPTVITDQRRIRLLASLAPHWNRYPGGWGVATQAFLADSVALRSRVGIVASSEITFAADRGMLPITVRNGLSQGVTVFISVRPRTPLLAIENPSFELTIEPNSQRKALIPAEALSNGTVELIVSIRSSAGAIIGQPTSVTTRVQAGWETPVTLALGVLLVAIFAIGVIRTVRRRRAGEPGDPLDVVGPETRELEEPPSAQTSERAE
jgi:hypothetical protein